LQHSLGSALIEIAWVSAIKVQLDSQIEVSEEVAPVLKNVIYFCDNLID
jgi:hypothetical protein